MNKQPHLFVWSDSEKFSGQIPGDVINWGMVSTVEVLSTKVCQPVGVLYLHVTRSPFIGKLGGKVEVDMQSVSLTALVVGVISWQRCSEDLNILISEEMWHGQSCLYVVRDGNTFWGEWWKVSQSASALSTLHDCHTHAQRMVWCADSIELHRSPLLWEVSAPVIRCEIWTTPSQIIPRWSPQPGGVGQPATLGWNCGEVVFWQQAGMECVCMLLHDTGSSDKFRLASHVLHGAPSFCS